MILGRPESQNSNKQVLPGTLKKKSGSSHNVHFSDDKGNIVPFQIKRLDTGTEARAKKAKAQMSRLNFDQNDQGLGGNLFNKQKQSVQESHRILSSARSKHSYNSGRSSSR